MEPHAALLAGPYQSGQVEHAMRELEKCGKPSRSSAVVAALTFSFWTTMFNKDYETLWQQALHQIVDASAPRGLKRKSFSGPLTRIRLLRNRIAHHEPILAWDLPKHHAQMMLLIEWLSPAAAAWCRDHDRFAAVFPAQRYALSTAERSMAE